MRLRSSKDWEKHLQIFHKISKSTFFEKTQNLGRQICFIAESVFWHEGWKSGSSVAMCVCTPCSDLIAEPVSLQRHFVWVDRHSGVDLIQLR